MMAVVMAGGKGTRLGYIEKPMIRLAGTPLINHIMRPFLESGLETIIAVSKNTPETVTYCLRSGYEIIMTDGNDYHEDLLYLTSKFGVILTTVADIPFMTQTHVKAILNSNREEDSVVGCTIIDDEIEPFGLNIVDGTYDRYLLFDDRYVGININTSEDLDLAEKIYSEVDYRRRVKSRLIA
jgi:adenosylcobinamide-phosphate guanylyltransferase